MALLKDRVALITGAGSGIGQGVAVRFAKEGARLALVDIRPEALEETAAQLKGAGVEFDCYTGDVSETSHVERSFHTSNARQSPGRPEGQGGIGGAET